jgi:hypothetical protein
LLPLAAWDAASPLSPRLKASAPSTTFQAAKGGGEGWKVEADVAKYELMRT